MVTRGITTEAYSRVRSLVLSRCLLGVRRVIYPPDALPRWVSTVLEGDRATTTSAECEAVSHALTLEMSSGELGAELFRCCTELDHVSTEAQKITSPLHSVRRC